MSLTRRDMLKRIGYGAAVGALATAGVPLAAWGDEKTGGRLNVLLFTADDMNWDSVSVYGCTTPQITPPIDRLAGEGTRFEHAHVTVAVCQPCRSVLMTGRYPHRSGGGRITPPSRTYRPDEVKVPGFLADLPEVRREIAECYSSAHALPDALRPERTLRVHLQSLV